MFSYFLKPDDEIFEAMKQAVEEGYLLKWSKFEKGKLSLEQDL